MNRGSTPRSNPSGSNLNSPPAPGNTGNTGNTVGGEGGDEPGIDSAGQQAKKSGASDFVQKLYK